MLKYTESLLQYRNLEVKNEIKFGLKDWFTTLKWKLTRFPLQLGRNKVVLRNKTPWYYFNHGISGQGKWAHT